MYFWLDKFPVISFQFYSGTLKKKIQSPRFLQSTFLAAVASTNLSENSKETTLNNTGKTTKLPNNNIQLSTNVHIIFMEVPSYRIRIKKQPPIIISTFQSRGMEPTTIFPIPLT